MCGKVRKAAALYRNTADPLQKSPSIPGNSHCNTSTKMISTAGSTQKLKFSFLHRAAVGDNNSRRSSAPGRIGQQDFLSFNTKDKSKQH